MTFLEKIATSRNKLLREIVKNGLIVTFLKNWKLETNALRNFKNPDSGGSGLF